MCWFVCDVCVGAMLAYLYRRSLVTGTLAHPRLLTTHPRHPSPPSSFARVTLDSTSRTYDSYEPPERPLQFSPDPSTTLLAGPVCDGGGGLVSLLGDDEDWATVERVLVRDWGSEVDPDGSAVWDTNEMPRVMDDVVVKVCDCAVDSLKVTAACRVTRPRQEAQLAEHSETLLHTFYPSAYLRSQNVGVNQANLPLRLGHSSRS